MIQAPEDSKPGRHGKIWKQIGLTPAQDRVVRQEMRKRRWNFQDFCDEALGVYFRGQGLPWPERTADGPKEAAS